MRSSISNTGHTNAKSRTAGHGGKWKLATVVLAIATIMAGLVLYLTRPLPSSSLTAVGTSQPNACLELNRQIENLQAEKRVQGRKFSAMLEDRGIQLEGSDAVEKTVRQTYAVLGEKAEACRLLLVSLQCLNSRNADSQLALKLGDAVIPICAGVQTTSVSPQQLPPEPSITTGGAPTARVSNPMGHPASRPNSLNVPRINSTPIALPGRSSNSVETASATVLPPRPRDQSVPADTIQYSESRAATKGNQSPAVVSSGDVTISY